MIWKCKGNKHFTPLISIYKGVLSQKENLPKKGGEGDWSVLSQVIFVIQASPGSLCCNQDL